MKTFDDLSKAEKEKIKFYIEMKNWFFSPVIMLIKVSVFLMLLGYLIIFFGNTILIVGAGTIVLIYGGILVLSGLLLINKQEKRVTLMTGLDNISEDIFEIKETDLLNMRRIWIKEKEKE